MNIKFLNLSGLSTFLTKLKSIFASKNHMHTLDDISGVVPITRGGTGATTSLVARMFLATINITASNIEPYSSDQNIGDIWLKIDE